MDFTLTEEQRELRSIVRKFLGARSSEPEVRRLMATEKGYDPDVWRQMSDQLGLPGLAIPEEYGGAGFSYVELGLVFEEMGRALLCAPYFSTVLAAEVLLRSGDEDAKKDLLPGIAAGETIATLALLERAAGWGADGIAVAATLGPGGWTLTGQKKHVLDGHVADLVLVVARTPAGVSVFAVDQGYVATPVDTMDQTRKQAELTFERTPARLIGEEGAGWATVERALDAAAILLGAEQVGGASAALDMAVEYAKVRIQFGRPIGSFQAIKHLLADTSLSLEMAKGLVGAAAVALGSGAPDGPELAHAAKAFVAERGPELAQHCFQVFGGIGYTWEHDQHFWLRRLAADAQQFGSAPWQRRALLDLVGVTR